MTIGYIFDPRPKQYDDIFKKVLKILNDKPLLIIGWKLAKKLFPNDFSINSFNIKNNIYWTYNDSVDGFQHYTMLDTFKDTCIKYGISKYEFKEFDLFQNEINSIDLIGVNFTFMSSNYIYYRSTIKIKWINLKVASILGYNVLPLFENVCNIVEDLNLNLNIKKVHQLAFI